MLPVQNITFFRTTFMQFLNVINTTEIIVIGFYLILILYLIVCFWFIKGNRIIADLRYAEKDIFRPTTIIFAPIKG